MSKIRVVVEIDVNDESLNDLGVSEDMLVSNIRVEPDDAIDGVLIFQNVPELDNTSDIILGCGKILSTKFMSKKTEAKNDKI